MEDNAARILIVDDEPGMCSLIRNVLIAGGYKRIKVAYNVSEAMSLVDDVDLVLTDLNMPGLSGVTLVRELRQSPRYAGLPIIAVTARAEIEEVHRLIREGVSDYVVKPFDDEVLLQKVRNALVQNT
jgi:two-component system chemotaxis response regulator CheY